MARDPEKRKRSREADKIRKRAKRELSNLQERYNETVDFQERRRLREQISSLQTDIAQSYKNPSQTLKRGGTPVKLLGTSSLEAASRRLGDTFKDIAVKAGSAVDQKTALGRLSQRPATSKKKISEGIDFEKEFREASRGGVTLLGEHGDIKVSAFYRVTQDLWETKDPAERNQAIMDGLGVSTLRAAYAKVMNMPAVRRVVRQLMAEEDAGHVIDSTSDMAEAYYSADRRIRNKSRYPRSIFAQLPVIEAVKAYGQ